jgi:hypothetical protein
MADDDGKSAYRLGAGESGCASAPRQAGSRPRAHAALALACHSIFFVVAVIAVIVIVVGNGGSSDLSFELAKAGIQLLAVAVLGGAVAQAFRSLDAHRDDLRRGTHTALRRSMSSSILIAGSRRSVGR